jgi:hypothetical protein
VPAVAADRLGAIALQMDSTVGVGAAGAATMAPVVEETADAPTLEPVPAPDPDADVVPIDSLAFDGEPVIAPPEVPPDVVEITALAPSDRLPLERAFDTYRQLMAAAPATMASASTASSVQADPEPAPPPMRRATDLPPVDIRSLCYSGRGALERAAEVRAEVTRRLGDSGDLRAVEPLLRELLDLVPLALDIAH